MIPFISVKTPAISMLLESFIEIENSGIYSNNGPKNTLFESRLREVYFSGEGSCLTVCNATIGLMMAMKVAARKRKDRKIKRYALMPAFTFAAAAHAAIWAGYIPLFCDIDPVTWAACPDSERRLLERYGESIDLIVPYATFGHCIDLQHYEELHQFTGAGIVIDAAASLGALDRNGRGFGTGFKHPIVYSMHATKTFGIGEGGLIYCTSPHFIETLRLMGNFGFGEPRSATQLGLNSKMTEMAAAIALACLATMEDVAQKRDELASHYRHMLPDNIHLQSLRGKRGSYQFMPVLLPPGCSRDAVRAQLTDCHIGTGAYFSPHLMQQPYFLSSCKADKLSVTNDIANRILSLPLWTDMTEEMVRDISEAISQILRSNSVFSSQVAA